MPWSISALNSHSCIHVSKQSSPTGTDALHAVVDAEDPMSTHWMLCEVLVCEIWSLGPGAESSCQALPAYSIWENIQLVHPWAQGKWGRWEGDSLGGVTVRCSESPACPLTQGPAWGNGSRGTHQPDPVPAGGAGREAPKLFGQASSVRSQAPNCSAMFSLRHFSHTQREAEA